MVEKAMQKTGPEMGFRDDPPVWLVPRIIKESSDGSLTSEWFSLENRYCLQKMKWYVLVGSIASLVSIYLDITYTPPADLYYALTGRGTLGTLGLLLFFWLHTQKTDNRPKFFLYKTLVAVFVTALVVYQFKYSADYPNRARYIPPFLFLLGAFSLRVGPAFSAILTIVYGAIVGIFLALDPTNMSEDLNHFAIMSIAVYMLQSRIRYEARLFVTEWKERQALSKSEREAKISASNAYGELVKLVYPHVVELIQAGRRIEETMPVGHSKAAVLCFDIADSSTIQHERFDAAIEEFQARFYDLMCQDYDGKSFVANGYRIKDVGDGVFYSVGFPFQAPGTQSICDRAVSLAEESLKIFHEVMKTLDYPAPITAGVGIAFGHVEGFFPKSGQKQYDLRGRAIVLATRYQELRKAIRKSLQSDPTLGIDSQNGSMIVINQDVFNNLSSNLRSRFIEFNLEKVGLAVRNDAHAKHAFWRAVQLDAAHARAKAKQLHGLSEAS